MTRQRTTLVALVCAMFLLCLPAAAQTFTTITPSWNEYKMVEEIGGQTPPFTPLTDGTLITGSNNAQETSGLFTVPLPFSFRFLKVSYEPTGCSLWISINGVAKLDNSPPTITGPGYNLAFNPDNRLLMPFWGKFKTLGNDGDGIYTKTVELLPGDPLGTRVLIVEWRVYEHDNTPSKRINFQMRLYEDTNIIEYFYNSPSYPGQLWQDPTQQCGAAIGIKNLGQDPCNQTQNVDDFSLIISNRTVPFDVHTHQPVHCIAGSGSGNCNPCTSGCGWTELSSTMLLSACPASSNLPLYSTSFHYQLPSVGYRIKPVIVDIGGDTNGVGSRVCNIYKVKDTVFFAARFRNYGTDTTSMMSVRAQLIRQDSSGNETTLIDISETIPAPAPGRSIVHQFLEKFILPDSLPDSLSNSTYRVIMWCDMVRDRNPLNDIVTYILNISGRYDGMACCINSPRLNIPGPPFRYAINKPIPVSVGFFNAGEQGLLTLPVRAMIVDANGAVHHNKTMSLSNMASGEERTVQFESWDPTQPGLYYIIALTELTGDDRPANDTLDSYPYATPGRRPPLTPLPRIPFIVAHPVDLALLPVMPTGSISTTPGRPIGVSARLSNNGAYDQQNVVVRARIVQRGTKRVLYDKSTTMSRIEAGAQRTAYFPNAVIGSTGTYDLTISVAPKGDAVAANNSAATTILCTKARLELKRPPSGSIDPRRRNSTSGEAERE